MKKIILLFIGLFGLQVLVHSQVTLFTKQELSEDLDSLYSIIQNVHLDMFANVQKDEFDKNIWKAKSQIMDSMNRIEFYKIVAPLVVSLDDGHTSLTYQREDLNSLGIKLFPYIVTVDWQDSSVFIKEDRAFPKTEIPAGSRIININNTPIKYIIANMYNYISGEKTFFKASNLPNSFTALYYILYCITEFNIEYEFNGQKQTSLIEGISYDQRYKTNTTQQNSSNSRFFSLSILPDSSIAILKINYFLDDGHWATFMDSTFNLIKKLNINDLIIDIRNNGGGFSVLGDSLLQYVSTVNFRQYGKVVIKTSRRQLDYQEREYNMKPQYPIGITEVGDDSNLEKLREIPNRFYGNKYLLIDNFTYSSAASFSWAFKYFKMGTVIGEESGGLAVCFGEVIQQTLPNTNLTLNISHNKYYHYGATDKDTHGTIPDYIVPAASALDYTIDLIMKGRK